MIVQNLGMKNNTMLSYARFEKPVPMSCVIYILQTGD